MTDGARSRLQSIGSLATNLDANRDVPGDHDHSPAAFALPTQTSTPQRYVGYLADIMSGVERMPNSDPAMNHARALSAAVGNGTIRNGGDLQRFLDQRGFGGSNWQGIDDGCGRNPGLADALVRFLLAPTPPVRRVFS